MTPIEFKNYWTTLRIIHGSLLLGVLSFGAVIYFVVQPDQQDPELTKLFNYLIPGLFIAVILVSILFLNRKLAEIRAMDDLPYQLNTYRSLNLIRWALAEGVTIFSLVGFLLTGDTNVLILAGLGFVYLFFQRPDKNRMVKELNFNNQEVRQLEIFGY
ncbi:MAG: hypothetical protein AAFY36_06820 [Bacteroidota bacterium]